MWECRKEREEREEEYGRCLSVGASDEAIELEMVKAEGHR